MASSPITSWQIDGETVEIVVDFILGAPKLLQMVIAAMKLRLLLLGRKASSLCSKRQRHHFANKGPHSQSYDFSSGYVRM